MVKSIETTTKLATNPLCFATESKGKPQKKLAATEPSKLY